MLTLRINPMVAKDLKNIRESAFGQTIKYAIWEDYVIICKVSNEYLEIYRVVNRYQDITRIFE